MIKNLRVLIFTLFVSLTFTLTAQEKVDYISEESEVDFRIIEQVPVYPGCKGDQKEQKKCFVINVQKHIAQNFNVDLPQKLDLSPGRKKITMMFKISRKGRVEDIEVKAPHPRLVKECKRVLKKLPRFKPGRTKGKAMAVKFSVPLTIDVE